MATKKGFLLLNNQIEIIETLTDEQAGQLLKAFYDYNLGKEIKLNGLMLTVFNNFKVVFDENEQKYQEKCEKNKQNIENYWKKIKEQNTNEYERIQSNTNVYEKIRTNTMATNININTNKNINTNTNLNINENININNDYILKYNSNTKIVTVFSNDNSQIWNYDISLDTLSFFGDKDTFTYNTKLECISSKCENANDEIARFWKIINDFIS